MSAVSRGTSCVATNQRCYHFCGYSECAVRSYIHSFRVACTTRAQWVCSEAENSAIVAIVNRDETFDKRSPPPPSKKKKKKVNQHNFQTQISFVLHSNIQHFFSPFFSFSNCMDKDPFIFSRLGYCNWLPSRCPNYLEKRQTGQNSSVLRAPKRDCVSPLLRILCWIYGRCRYIQVSTSWVLVVDSLSPPFLWYNRPDITALVDWA